MHKSKMNNFNKNYCSNKRPCNFRFKSQKVKLRINLDQMDFKVNYFY
jgi:hypothetical protein